MWNYLRTALALYASHFTVICLTENTSVICCSCHWVCTVFPAFISMMQGLEPILDSSTDGIIVKRCGDLDFQRRCKLAGIVINHVIQKLGLRWDNVLLVETYYMLLSIHSAYFYYKINLCGWKMTDWLQCMICNAPFTRCSWLYERSSCAHRASFIMQAYKRTPEFLTLISQNI